MDESRKVFESWCRKTRPCLTTLKNCDGVTYSYDKTQTAWKSWQASRAAIEIELPKTFPGEYNTLVMYADDVEYSLEAAGIKVKE